MFTGDVPLHPLVVHAAVVLTPLAVLAALLFALLPRWRWATRLPAVVAADVAAVAVVAAWLTGRRFLGQRPQLEPLVASHQHWATLLLWAVIPFAVLVSLAAWTLTVSSPLPNGRSYDASGVLLDRGLAMLVAVAAVVVLVLVVVTGDLGAQAVWGSSGG